MAEITIKRRADIEAERERERKESLPYKLQTLESENADLWYADMLKSASISEHDRDIADIWYAMMTGGADS